MKQRIVILLSIIGLLLISFGNADAAYRIKKSTVQTIENQFVISPVSNYVVAPIENNNTIDATAIKQVNKKRSLASRIINYLFPTEEALIPLPVYILLAFPFLGWLAMGINDDFTGDDWWICIILYCCLWFPGFIFTLIKMKKYYPIHDIIEGKGNTLK